MVKELMLSPIKVKISSDKIVHIRASLLTSTKINNIEKSVDPLPNEFSTVLFTEVEVDNFTV